MKGLVVKAMARKKLNVWGLGVNLPIYCVSEDPLCIVMAIANFL